MRIRFGFVAMSVHLDKASPSQTMTVTNFLKITDREAGLRKLTNIAHSNLVNTLRILRHAYASGVYLYRFTSKLVPLYGHDLTKDWDYFNYLAPDFREIGNFVKAKGMRVSFHPDHFTILNSPDLAVVERSIEDLKRHVIILEKMGLDDRDKLVIHIGGGYKDKNAALQRFITNWSLVPEKVRCRITLENDDKIFTAADTLKLCQQLALPMVLDIHHHWCNSGGQELNNLLEPIIKTWETSGLAPKIHVSSPRSVKDIRSHADYVNAKDVLNFINLGNGLIKELDIMVEAKKKDESLFKLVSDLASYPDLKQESPGVLLRDSTQ